MQTTWIRFLLPPKDSIYERAQRARLLHFMLVVVFVGGLLIGLSNYLHGWMVETLVLSLLALICLVGLYLNRKGYYRIAAWIFCISVYAVLALMMYKGAGLYDETVLASTV